MPGAQRVHAKDQSAMSKVLGTNEEQHTNKPSRQKSYYSVMQKPVLPTADEVAEEVLEEHCHGVRYQRHFRGRQATPFVTGTVLLTPAVVGHTGDLPAADEVAELWGELVGGCSRGVAAFDGIEESEVVHGGLVRVLPRAALQQAQAKRPNVAVETVRPPHNALGLHTPGQRRQSDTTEQDSARK